MAAMVPTSACVSITDVIAATPIHPALRRDTSAFTLEAGNVQARSSAHALVSIAHVHTKHKYRVQARTLIQLSAESIDHTDEQLIATVLELGPQLNKTGCLLPESDEFLAQCAWRAWTPPASDASPTENEVVVNRVAELTTDEQHELVAFMTSRFSEKEPMTVTTAQYGLPVVEGMNKLFTELVSDATVCDLSVVLRREGAIVGTFINERFVEEDMNAEPACPDELKHIFALLHEQDSAAFTWAKRVIPNFAEALGAGHVGHAFVLAANGPNDATAAFNAMMNVFAEGSFKFVVVEATNPFTAAACDEAGGLAVHTYSYADKLVDDHGPIGPTTSASILYLIKLA